MKQMKALCIILSLAAMVLLGAGCSKLTRQNYDKLKAGMDFKAVKDILGDDAICVSFTAGSKTCTWKDEPKNIMVKFVDGKVIAMASNGI
ncbi:MAG: DUF3862 domain-containing protein [Deltaproteobacteria bacterium]|nr:DUF3862 domain-containing protein [Deltaproteobacteria bacterium]